MTHAEKALAARSITTRAQDGGTSYSDAHGNPLLSVRPSTGGGYDVESMCEEGFPVPAWLADLGTVAYMACALDAYLEATGY